MSSRPVEVLVLVSISTVRLNCFGKCDTAYAILRLEEKKKKKKTRVFSHLWRLVFLRHFALWATDQDLGTKITLPLVYNDRKFRDSFWVEFEVCLVEEHTESYPVTHLSFGWCLLSRTVRECGTGFDHREIL